MANPLINRNFGLMWVGKTISLLGDKFYAIALAWWVLESTGSAGLMSFVMALSIFPGIVCGIVSGPFVDRWNRKVILVVADAVRALAVSLVALLYFCGGLTVPVVLAVSAVLSLCSSFFDPAAQSVIPLVVSRSDVARANSFNQLSSGLTTVAGPVLGAIGVSFAGFGFAFAGNAVSFAVSGILEAFMRIDHDGIKPSEKKFGRELREGFAFIGSRPMLCRIVSAVGVAHFFVAGLMVALPVIALRFPPAAGIGVLGFLQCSVGVGMIFGSLVMSFMNHGPLGERGLFIRFAAFGAVFCALAVARCVVPAFVFPLMVFVAAYGFSLAQAGVHWSTILQREIPPHLAGRVFSLTGIVGNCAMPAGFVLFGLALDRFPLALTLGISGALLIFFACVFLALVPRGPSVSDLEVPHD